MHQSEVLSEFQKYAFDEWNLQFPDGLEMDGSLHRCSLAGGKDRQKTGWYQFFMDGNPACVFGDWRSTNTCVWSARKASEMTKEERAEFARKMEEARRHREEEKMLLHHDAARVANAMLRKSEEADPFNDYLVKKNVGAYGVRSLGPNILMPLIDDDGTVWNVQEIKPSFKKFLEGGKIKGCFHRIDGSADAVFVVEGYATGATIHEATGSMVYVALNRVNLLSVCRIVNRLHNRAVKILASDDDRFTIKPVVNPGQVDAENVCAQTPFLNMKPEFNDSSKGTDWNDLANEIGKVEVARRINDFINNVRF